MLKVSPSAFLELEQSYDHNSFEVAPQGLVQLSFEYRQEQRLHNVILKASGAAHKLSLGGTCFSLLTLKRCKCR